MAAFIPFSKRFFDEAEFRRGYFYDFSDAELDVSSKTDYRQVVDRTGNHRIILRIDHNNDGIIVVPNGRGTREIRAIATAYSVGNEGEVAIKLCD